MSEAAATPREFLPFSRIVVLYSKVCTETHVKVRRGVLDILMELEQ